MFGVDSDHTQVGVSGWEKGEEELESRGGWVQIQNKLDDDTWSYMKFKFNRRESTWHLGVLDIENDIKFK